MISGRKRSRRSLPNSATPSTETRFDVCSDSRPRHVCVTESTRRSSAVIVRLSFGLDLLDADSSYSSSPSSSSSSSASKEIPGKETIRRSTLLIFRADRTRWSASRACAAREIESALAEGRKKSFRVMS